MERMAALASSVDFSLLASLQSILGSSSVCSGRFEGVVGPPPSARERLATSIYKIPNLFKIKTHLPSNPDNPRQHRPPGQVVHTRIRAQIQKPPDLTSRH